jgi:ribonuclease P protein component
MAAVIPFVTMPHNRLTFSHSLRLKRRKDIEALFREGGSISNYPVRLLYRRVASEPGIALKMAISVPKRTFKKAVDRNRIRRQIREIYRTHKTVVWDKLLTYGITYHIMLIYTGKERPVFAELSPKIIVILQRLSKVHERDPV